MRCWRRGNDETLSALVTLPPPLGEDARDRRALFPGAGGNVGLPAANTPGEMSEEAKQAIAAGYDPEDPAFMAGYHAATAKLREGHEELARQICHAVEQRSDDCDMEMHARVMDVLKHWFNK